MITDLAPYAAYKDSGLPWLGSIPEQWTVKRVKNLFRCIDVRSSTGDEELLTVSSSRGVIPRRLTTVTMFKAESYIGHKLCWPNDLVINSLWAWARGLGVSSHQGIVSTAYGIYRLREDTEVDPRFVHALVRSTAFHWELQVRSKGVWTSRLQLTDDSFLSAPFPIPPLGEQRAIVKYLDYMDRRIRHYIQAKQKLIKLVEEQRQVVITQAVNRGLDGSVRYRPSTLDWIGDIPEHWEVLPVKRVLRRLIDCEHKTAPEVDASDFRVVRTTAVRHGRLQLSGTYCTSGEAFSHWTRRGLPEPGDVIFTWEAPVGEACTVPEGQCLCLGQRTVLMKLQQHRYDADFLVHMIYGGPPSYRVRLASQGSTVGHFNMDDIGNMRILVPPLKEQRAIVSSLSMHTRALDRATAEMEREIDLLREYRMRLIADVVAGKLDVRGVAASLPDELSQEELIFDEMESFAEDELEDDDSRLQALLEEVEA